VNIFELEETASTTKFYFTKNAAINCFTLLEQRYSISDHNCSSDEDPRLDCQIQYCRDQKTSHSKDRRYNGPPHKLTADDDKAFGQSIRRNNETMPKEPAQKLLQDRGRQVSRWTIQRSSSE
jgi:hypothetical protein